MQEKSSIDERWITYISIILIYTLFVINDWLSAIIFTLLLLQIIGQLSKRWMTILSEVVFITDFLLKSPFLSINKEKLQINGSCIQMLFSAEAKPIIFVYIATHGYNLYLLFYYLINWKKENEYRQWGPLMTQIMVYSQPILMELMSLISFYWPIKVIWSILACLQLLDIFPKVNHFICCILLSSYYFYPSADLQYKMDFIKHSDQYISQSTTKVVISTLFVFLLILMNVYNYPHPDYKQQPRKSMTSSAKKIIAKRQIQQQQLNFKRKSIITLSLTILLYLITSSLGNIFIIFGIYSNIPQFKSKRFFFFVTFGIVVSIILQPEQVSYFIYLYIVILIVNQKINSTQIISFEVHSYSFFLDFYRLYIMLNHVSFLNWMIGIFRSSIIVTLALMVRLVCRYFTYVSVFLGTNDFYGMKELKFLNLHSMADLVLVIYLILLCLYSPSKTKVYQSSTVTNILLEYPILKKMIKPLKILRIFNWVSYIFFSLIILSRKPSLYIAIHIFFLVLILICDTINAQQIHKNTNKILKALWSSNFYLTIIMIFTRYFYFLKQYQNSSELMDYLLQILSSYKAFLGLDQLSKETEGFSLGKYFLYDAAVVILSWINIYVYAVKIYHETKLKDVSSLDQQKQKNIPFLLKNFSESGKFQNNQEEQEKQKFEDINYFYQNCIQPIELTEYLIQHEFKNVEKLIKDCMLDLCFGIIVLAFRLEKQPVDFIFYLPHFVVSAYSYYYRFKNGSNLKFTQLILGFSSAYSFLILFASYLYITYLQMHNQEIPSALVKVYVTYILCIILCFLYKTCCCIPKRDSNDKKSYHSLIFFFFPFSVKSQKLWTEILSIFSQFWMAFTMACFFTNIFSPKIISTFTHPIIIAFLLIKKIGKQKSQTWLYILCIVSIIDIWNYDFFGYFTVLSTTIFYAVKTGQKLAQEEENEGYRQNDFSDSVSVIDFPQLQEDDEAPQSEQQRKWQYYIPYCTIIQMLPQLISLVWMFGVVWLSPSIIATLLISFSYGNLFYQILVEKKRRISQTLMVCILIITSIFFLYETVQYLIRYFGQNEAPYDHSEMGLFLIFDSCFFYLILKKRSAWFGKRVADAQKYWKQKTELIGELGSQLHNQKKLITLEKHYSSKQKLTEKVNKISAHLKMNGKKAYFQSFDSLFKSKESEKNSYQLYTNMLIFLDMRLLKKCFLMLNQYLKPAKDENIVEKAKGIRKQIFRVYQRSFDEAFSRIKQQDESILKQDYSNVRQSVTQSRQSTVNLEKLDQINQRYKRCFQIITKSTQKFNKIFRLIIQHFQIISMMIVIGWNLFGGVYTIPTNILIFGWAVVLENKTTVTFWFIVMSYVCFILIIKQIIMYLPDTFIINFIFYYHGQDYLYQFLLILISVIQITLINLGGTRNKTYSERQSIYDAFYRSALNKASNGTILDKETQFMEIYKNLSEPQKHSFWYRVFSKSRFKPGKDFYPLMSTIQLVILLYIFFFYDMMELQSKKNRKSIGELLTVSQFSSHMVIVLFIQIMVMILDRFIISLNLVDEDNQTLENFFLSFTFSYSEVKQIEAKKLEKIGIFDFLLVLKYLFHLTLLLIINFYVYFYIPSAGLTKSLIPSCTTESQCSKSYTYLSIFLILYFAYFLVSGLQIKHGFNRNKCKNVLMEKFHWVNYYTYKLFTAIPFAWEFKKICDWTVTSTALPLFHWMKFQDINARLYQSKCQAEMIKIKPLGTPWNKYFLGPSGFIFILLLAFSPFIIYSSVNPFAVKDAVVGARSDIYLRMDDRYDYKFFSTSHANVMQKTETSFQLKLTNENLYLVKMSRFPDENFLHSEPVVKKIAKNILKSIETQEHKFAFVLNFHIIQQEGGQSQIEWAKKQLTLLQLKALYDMLTLKTNRILLSKFYSPFPGETQPESIILSTSNSGQYYEVQVPSKTQSSKEIYIYYLTSQKFKVSLGILTFYVTYILVISKLLRFYLTGTTRNIMYEGCYLDSILVLCEAVRQARIVENFIQEESFYFELMDIMRHPKMLKQITGDFLSFRKKYI